MKLKRKFKESEQKSRSFRLFFTGFSMGMADIVPGVSGGTIAFLYGIYDELLYSLKVLTGQFPRLLITGKFKQAFMSIPLTFLLPLLTGIVFAIFSMVGILSYLAENYSLYVWSLFFGLVIASAWVVSSRVTAWNSRRLLLTLLGFLITYLFVGLPVIVSGEPTTFVLAVTGAIASCAMILPGISGSLILVILGQYQFIITAVSENRFKTLLTFTLGALLGLAAFSRLLSWLLREHHNAVIAFLIGVILGSLRKVWPWQVEQADKTFIYNLPQLNWSLIACLMLGVCGFLIVWKLEKIGIAKEHTDIDDREFVLEVKSQHD